MSQRADVTEIPVRQTNRSLTERRNAAIPRGVAQATQIYPQRALGAELWDVEGRRYIDFAAGIAVLNTGHNHPKVTAAARAQLDKFNHVCFQVTPYEPYVELAERLNQLAPGPSAKKTIFLTTGAEAVENAVKIARFATRRSGVIAFSGGFHGRTFMGMALTGKVAPYKAGFGPLPAETYHVPYPNQFHDISSEDSLEALAGLFRSDLDPGSVAAMIVEPMQGEGGFYVAPPEFLRRLRELCDQHRIVLIVDEIQTGVARTGKFWAIEHSGVEPDLITIAKGVAGGFPLSAVTGKAALMDTVGPGGLGGTFAGSPVACAAALAVLEVIAEEGLIERASAIGRQFRDRLQALAARSRGVIGEVRNLGAMAAIELVKSGQPGTADAELTRALATKAAEHGVIVLTCGVRANVIRFLPPLIISDALIKQGFDAFEHALRDLSVIE